MRRDINFFSVYHAHADGNFSRKINLIALCAAIGICVIMLGSFAFIKIADLSVTAGISSANAVINTPSAAQSASRLAAVKEKTAALNQYNQAAKNASSGFDAMPKLTSALLTAIAKMEPTDLDVQSLTYAGETLTLGCTSANDASAAVFVRGLEDSGRFESVNYPGETLGDTAKGKATYSFSVTIKFRRETAK
jgi:hypothetical protein